VVAPREWFQLDDFGRPRCKEVWFRGCHSDVYVRAEILHSSTDWPAL
jgi:hypothetical protein